MARYMVTVTGPKRAIESLAEKAQGKGVTIVSMGPKAAKKRRIASKAKAKAKRKR